MDQVNTLRGELNWYSRTIQLLEGRAANLMAPQLVKLRRAARECEQRLVEALANLRVEDAGVRQPADGGFDSHRDHSRLAARRTPCWWSITAWTSASTPACSPATASRSSRWALPASLRRVLQLLRFQLSKFRLGAEYVKLFHHQLLDATNAHLLEFYERLIAPIAGHLTQASHLIIAPHDFLHYLPFHALPDAHGTAIGRPLHHLLYSQRQRLLSLRHQAGGNLRGVAGARRARPGGAAD